MSTVSINLRLPDELHAALKQAAEKEQRSLNNLIVVLLTRSLEGEQ
jgi:predicted HicB family RNase H-like nuclease